MIYLNPTGGLGNALFQIAALYSLAIDNSDSLCLLNVKKFINDLDNDIRLSTNHAEKYRFILDKFTQEDFNVPNWMPNQKYSTLYQNTKYPQITLPFQYEIPKYSSGHEYVGYFQSEKYFKHHRIEILELFKPTNEFSCEINKYLHLFNGVSIHVRRGDYIKEHEGRMIYLDENYYNNALSKLPINIPVLVFSDEIEWCKEKFIGNRYFFIDEPDYISIYIMSKMKYNIIANSSFSWWGAWLGDAERVFAPKGWFNENVQHKSFEYDIIPNNWEKV